jgi:hypothetical protein
MNTSTWNLPLRPKRRGYVSLEEHVEELADIVTRSKHLVVSPLKQNQFEWRLMRRSCRLNGVASDFLIATAASIL